MKGTRQSRGRVPVPVSIEVVPVLEEITTRRYSEKLASSTQVLHRDNSHQKEVLECVSPLVFPKHELLMGSGGYQCYNCIAIRSGLCGDEAPFDVTPTCFTMSVAFELKKGSPM